MRTEEPSALSELAQSDDKLRELVQNANSIIYRRDREGRVTFFNRFAQRFFGYAEGEIVGKHVVGTIVPPTDSDGRDLAAMITDISTRTERYVINENENIRRNGERVWVAWTNKAVRDKDGQVVEILCIGNDVTERKRAERLAVTQRNLSVALASTASTDEALRLCMEAAIAISGMDCGAVYLVDEKSSDLRLAFSQGLPEAFATQATLIPKASTRARKTREGKPFYFDPRASKISSEALLQEGLRAVAVLPVQHDGRVIACIVIASHTLDALPLSSRAALEAVASQIGSAVARVQAKEALAGEVDLWQRTFDAIQYQVALIDRNHRIVRANLAMRRAYPGQRLIGRACYELFHGSSCPVDGCPTRRVFQTGEAIRAEIREPHLGDRWLEISAYPVQESAGEQMQVVHVACDITARKQAEEEREATIHLLRLVNSSDNLEELLRAATTFLRQWSGCDALSVRMRMGERYPRFESRGPAGAFGRTEEDFCCAPGALSGASVGCICRNIIADRFTPFQPFQSQRGSFWTNNASDVLGGDDVQGTSRRCCGLGHESIALIPLRAAGETFGVLQFSDARRGRFSPERVAMFERLADNLAIGLAQHLTEEERRLLASAFEQAAECIVITDAQGVIQHVNPAFGRVTGYPAAETIGQRLDFLHAETQGAAFYGDILDTLRRGDVWTGHLVNRRKDGSPFEEEATISPVRNASGEIVRFVAVKRDVTHEVALEAQFRHAQKMEAVGRLAGGVAHDFNNLLTAIIGFSDLILDRLEPKSPVRREVEQIKRAGDRASSLVRQLLAFSRKQVLQPETLDLGSVVADLEKMLRRLIGEDIELQIRSVPDLGMVRADPSQLEQVIMNLVVNARDAMPRGGKLCIETTNVAIGEAFCSEHVGARPGPYVLLAVTDSGTGMNGEVLAHIFEPFFTTKEKGRGTGLGLSTVYGIVTQSGGHVTVESAIGRGSTFRIYLPRVEAPAPRVRAPVPGASSLRGSETVLLVEDEETIRNLIRIILQGHGYTVLTAGGAEEALDLSARHSTPVHLLITDLVMPGLNGFDLAQVLLLSRPEMKVLYMSGYLDNAILNQGLSERGGAFIPKPFTPEAFAAKVRAVLTAPAAR